MRAHRAAPPLVDLRFLSLLPAFPLPHDRIRRVRLLFDTCVWNGVAAELEAAGRGMVLTFPVTHYSSLTRSPR